MEKSTSNLSDYYTELGNIMFDYYNGKELNPLQISMMIIASDKDKLFAMEYVSSLKLKGKEYTNFCKNKKKIIHK